MALKSVLNYEKTALYLMDASAFIFKGYYGNMKMTRTDGFPTGAIYSVVRTLLRIIKEEEPQYFSFVQDGGKGSFRNEIYPLYKAQRSATPEELVMQFKPIEDFVDALGLHREVAGNCEADDCIASLAKKNREDNTVIIVGIDKDLKQCLHENVHMWDPSGGGYGKEIKTVSLEDFRTKTGLEPTQWPDVQAIIGDSSDNIPGIPGVGEKTAEKIFKDFQNLEAIRDNIDSLAPKIKDKFQGNIDNMFMYRQLTTLSTSCCENTSLKDLEPKGADIEACLQFFASYQMPSLQKEFENLVKKGLIKARNGSLEKAVNMQDNKEIPKQKVKESKKNASAQLSLFDTLDVVKEEVNTLAKSSTLKPSNAREIALFFASDIQRNEEGFYLSYGEEDYHYTGNSKDLCEFLQNFDSIICLDLKNLIQKEINFNILFEKDKDIYDLSLIAYLINPEQRDYSWAKVSNQIRYSARGKDIAWDIATRASHNVKNLLLKDLKELALDEIYKKLELPLLNILASMENKGIKLDIKGTEDFLFEVQKDLEDITNTIYDLAGGKFNIRSAQQTGDVLFNKLALPTKGKTKGGQSSTSQESLEKLIGSHEIIDKLLEYRKLEKLRSTYLEPLPKLVDSKDRIHTTFNHMATATGRLSSSNPNLQNIPIRGDLGKRVRACFIADEGYSLISADYSQIELRVLAQYSQEKTLIDAFIHDEDIHKSTAALLNNVSLEDVTPEQRSNAKTINFGLLYGMGARKLAQDIKVTTKEASAFIERYFERFNGIKSFYETSLEDARDNGYVTTIAGRRRPLPDLHSPNGQAKALAERQAVNTLIQGSAADIIKMAMISVYNDEELKSYKAELLLQVHDELILSVADEYAQKAGERVAYLMANALVYYNKKFDIPLKVEYSSAKNWLLAH